MTTATTGGADDINAVVSGYLRDLAYAQSTEPRMFGYKRAAAAIFQLERSLVDLVREHAGELPRIPGIGPSSARIIREVLEGGGSASVERAIDASGRRADVERRRTLRVHFLSRAAVVRILHDSALGGPSFRHYLADLQMHSE